MIWYIFVNCNWFATQWQLYCTHLHTNNTQNDRKQTIHRTTQKFWEQHKHFGRVWAVPWLGELYPGICLATEEKAQKTSVRVGHISGLDILSSSAKWMRRWQVSPHFGICPKSSVCHNPKDASSLVTILIASHLSLILCIYSNAKELRREFM
jgi:hypothetical protein